jgi:hypothetical protein
MVHKFADLFLNKEKTLTLIQALKKGCRFYNQTTFYQLKQFSKLLGGGVVFGYFFPIDYAPKSGNIIGATILVF